jgi:hypothetical protein
MSGATTTIVDRIDYAADTALASVRGPLATSNRKGAAAGNTNFGWFTGGTPGGGSVTTVTRIDYAADTGVHSVRGPFNAPIRDHSSSGNADYGWFSGGYNEPSPGQRSTVNRITYISDTISASVRGPLSSARYGIAGAGNTNYGWQGGGRIDGVARSIVDRIDYAADTATANIRGPLSVNMRIHGAAGGFPG